MNVAAKRQAPHVGVKVWMPPGLGPEKRRAFLRVYDADSVKQLTVTMPCGAAFEWNKQTLPLETQPCPCGRATHVPVLWEVTADA